MFKKRLISLFLIFFILITIFFAAFALGDVVYTHTKYLADNLILTTVTKWDETFGRTESYTLRLTGDGEVYAIVLNGDTVFGGFRISEMVEYAESLGLNVLAVVNGDFFMQNTVPIGIVIENGRYKSGPGIDRSAVVFGYDGSVDIIQSASVVINLFNQGGGVGIDGRDNFGSTVSFSNFNKTRSEMGGLMLYSEDFSDISTRTTTPGWFVRLKILEGSLSLTETMLLEVTDTFRDEAQVEIGEGYLLLTAADASYLDEDFEKFAIGDLVSLNFSCSDVRLLNAQYATGSGDILISDGLITDNEEWTPSLKPRAPRTAFGLLADGSTISFVMDGRNSEHSIGLTLDELAEEMLNLGCIYAVNLDGGGSTALSVRIAGQEGTNVFNRPSDGSQRRCSTYILYVTDVVSSGEAKHLRLENDGVVLLAESSLEISFAAADEGYFPVETPDDVIAETMGFGAIIEDFIYTAGSMAVTDRISLYSPSTGASGMGEIYVITRPTSITPTRRDSGISQFSARLSPATIFEFGVVATYYRRPVVSQLHSFSYTVVGYIGEMLEPGVFQASLLPGETGSIVIEAGGRSVEISIEINGFADMVDHWAKEFAEYLLQSGITKGVSEHNYGPSALMERGDYILMLYRAVGEPEVSVFSEFDDVPPDMYYTNALIWAKKAGIAEALEDNNFYPQMPISRQDAFTFTYRALALLNINYLDGYTEDLLAFTDVELLEEYAMIPTATLMALGIVEGVGDSMLSPQSTLTRAQMAKVLALVLQL
ncbi:MAG: phosphodiester glycosidase family protein [Oscillospiraceae bacterium]|nr:phosphodiester glycosidase family protein [Oscillospiraceae bacterium]